MFRHILAVSIAPFFAASALAQTGPEQTIKAMTVAPGLQVELFAAEPMVINPISIDVDHVGRVWACEAVNYRCQIARQPLNREEGDRIVILTDTDGDGKANDSTVFYQGKELFAPLGIAVAAKASIPKKGEGKTTYSYKVFVCQSPDILLFEDKDGDGKADGPPKKFLSGFRGVDHDHGVHGINIGPDGRLYFTVGDAGVRGLRASDGGGETYTSNTTSCRAGTVWRCDMDGTHLEMIAHNFRNSFECCVNSLGEIWLTDTSEAPNESRICHVLPGGDYGYHPRGFGESRWHEEQRGIVRKTLSGLSSPTGLCFYEGTLLAKQYNGQLLNTDMGTRELQCFQIKTKGAGHDLGKQSLLTSKDNWFRPSDVCVAPDGSLMLADLYDPALANDGMGDSKMGRIYRLTPKGHKGYKVPTELKLETLQGLIDTLMNPCLASRWLSAQIVFYYPRVPVMDKPPEDIRCRLEMLGYKSEEGRLYLANRLSSLNGWTQYDPQKLTLIRSLAMLSQNRENGGLGYAGEGATYLANDRAAVRRELLIMFSTQPAEGMVEPFYVLAKLHDGKDPVYRAALNIACGPYLQRREAILAGFDKHFPEWNDKVADLVWELAPPSSLAKLGPLLENAKLTTAQKERVVDILGSYDDVRAGKALVAVLTRNVPVPLKVRAVDVLKVRLADKWKELATTPELKNAIDTLLKEPKLTVSGLQLVAASNAMDRVDTVIALVGSKPANAGIEVEAVRTLGKLRLAKSIEILQTIVRQPSTVEEPGLAGVAIGALAQLASTKATDEIGQKAFELLQHILEGREYSSRLKQATVEALAMSQAGTAWLIQLREQNKLPAELVGKTGRLLRNTPFFEERFKAMRVFPIEKAKPK